MIRKSKRSRPAKKAKVQTLPVWSSYQNADGDWCRTRVGSAWAKEKGRVSLAITPLASWIGGDPVVNLSIFLEPYDSEDNDDDDDDE